MDKSVQHFGGQDTPFLIDYHSAVVGVHLHAEQDGQSEPNAPAVPLGILGIAESSTWRVVGYPVLFQHRFDVTLEQVFLRIWHQQQLLDQLGSLSE